MEERYTTTLCHPDRWLNVTVTDPDSLAAVLVAEEITTDTREPKWHAPANQAATVSLLHDAIRQRLRLNQRFFVAFNWKHRRRYQDARLFVTEQDMTTQIWVVGRWVSVPAEAETDFLVAALIRVDTEVYERESHDRLLRTATRKQLEHPAVTSNGF